MARLAVISDIHGNAFALETVLASIERDGVDQIVYLGDIAEGGPRPAEAIERLAALGCPAVLGNTDDYFIKPLPEKFQKDPEWRDVVTWGSEQLNESHRSFLRSLPLTVEIDLDGETVTCYHASPNSYSDLIFPDTPESDLEHWFAGVDSPLLIGGHTHQQMLRRWNGRLLMNPGSAGRSFHHLPIGSGGIRPWCEYAVITRENGETRVEFRHIPLDLDAMIADAQKSGLPHVESWIAEWAL
jgi:predicted phosphodiesterase